MVYDLLNKEVSLKFVDVFVIVLYSIYVSWTLRVGQLPLVMRGFSLIRNFFLKKNSSFDLINIPQTVRRLNRPIEAVQNVTGTQDL